MNSDDPRRVPKTLRKRAQAREALVEFAETANSTSSAAESAFGPAEGARKRAEARRVNLSHFAAHVLLLAFLVGLLGSGLAYFALSLWPSGTAGMSWHQTTSGEAALYAASTLAALVAVALLVVAVHFLSKLAAPRRERERFLSALPPGLRLARTSLLVVAWLVLCAAFLAWFLGGT